MPAKRGASLDNRVTKLEIMHEMALAQAAKLEMAVKEHMIQEEIDRKEIITKLSTIEQARSGDKRFIGGVVFTITCLWAAILGGWAIIAKLKFH